MKKEINTGYFIIIETDEEGVFAIRKIHTIPSFIQKPFYARIPAIKFRGISSENEKKRMLAKRRLDYFLRHGTFEIIRQDF